MPAHAVLGAQWGDEGKDKIVDFLAEDADIVARFSGGNNAGHTVINDLGEFSLHLLPCGVFNENVTNIIGNGLVINPDILISEINALNDVGIDISDRLIVSDRVHLILPHHVVLDNLSEIKLGTDAIGTTGKGIGPAYGDKISRKGIRAADLLDIDTLKDRLIALVESSNQLVDKNKVQNSLSVDELLELCKIWSEKLHPYIAPTGEYINDQLYKGYNAVLEGAQGVLLDIDHGTYPYVTSSNSSIGGAITGLSIQPRYLTSVVGVFKAYTTRVGAGPLPTELFDDVGESIRTIAREFGTTTGRARRVGWFDGVVAKYSHQVNGYTSAVITRLDVLDQFEVVKICTGYELDGEIVDQLPGGMAALSRCVPVYEELPGWDIPTAGMSDLNKLPKNARHYVDRIQDIIGAPIDIISTGPHRDETITVKPLI
ncbi:MAG: adenylosuccinate synthase [Chloroflexi bacterium]|nr:adenylosuccinate synthase [Chloroflexota bacterium]